MFQKILNLSMVVLLSTFLGCGSKETAKEQKPSMTGAESDNKIARSKSKRAAKIVFVGQKQACDCTRNRIDKSWKVLQGALDGRKDITIERIALDVETERYNRLDETKSLMVPPGLYFFDAETTFIDLLQGEVDEYQILEMVR